MATFNEEKQKKQLDELHREEEEQLVAMLAESKYKLPYIDLSRLGIDNEALRAISEKDARDLKIGPFKLFGKNIFIAVRSPSDDLLAKIKEQIERKVERTKKSKSPILLYSIIAIIIFIIITLYFIFKK